MAGALLCCIPVLSAATPLIAALCRSGTCCFAASIAASVEVAGLT
jgi:hypothetical protein